MKLLRELNEGDEVTKLKDTIGYLESLKKNGLSGVEVKRLRKAKERLKSLTESMGAARGLATIKYTKKEMADATHDMHIDKMLSKKYKPEDITDEQAEAFVDQMHVVDKKFPQEVDGKPNDSDEVIQAFEAARAVIIAKVLENKRFK